MNPILHCPRCEQWHAPDEPCPPERGETLALVVIGAIVLAVVLVLIWVLT